MQSQIKVPGDFFYRCRLLEISDHLEARDVERLSFICREVVPKAQAEKISEGYQLFDILEERGLLSPCDLTFLYTCLRAIGKISVAEKLACQLPWVPDSLQTHHQLTLVFRHKAHWSMEALAMIQLINKEEMKSICGEVHLILTEDLSVPLWQPDESTAAVSIDEVVSATLSSLFLYTKSQLEAIQISLPNNTHELNKPARECEEQLKVFEDMLDKIGWNSKIRDQVKSEKDVQRKTGRQACQNIHEICKDLLRSEELDDNIQRVEEYVYALYSARHSMRQVPLTYQWLINLLHLAKSSIVDLNKHLQLILNLLSQERQSILNNYETLLKFVGKDTLERLQLAPQLPRNTCDTALVMGWPITRQIFLIQFANLAMGYSINPMEMLEKYAEIVMHDSMVENRIQTYITLSKSVKGQIFQGLLNLRQRAVEFTSHSYADIQELFPDPAKFTN